MSEKCFISKGTHHRLVRFTVIHTHNQYQQVQAHQQQYGHNICRNLLANQLLSSSSLKDHHSKYVHMLYYNGGYFTVMNLIHIQYGYTSQVQIQRCASFHIMHQPEASPRKITSAGCPFQISAAVASQLCLNLSSVLNITGITKRKCSAGSQE